MTEASRDRSIVVPSHARAETPTEKVRWAWLDRLRIIAMIDIISYHIAGEHLLGGIGLPTFLLSAVALGARKTEPQPLGQALPKRAERLLIPWLFWSVIYGVWVTYRQARQGGTVSEAFNPWMLLYGTHVHLWFLPFIFLALLAADALKWPLSGLKPKRAIIASLVGGVVCLAVAGPVWLSRSWPTPILQWLFSLSSIPLGVGFGRVLALQDDRSRRRWLIGIALAAVTGLTVATFWQPEDQLAVFWRRYAASVVLICLSISRAGSLDGVSRRVHDATFGIYLIHMLPVSAGKKFGLDTLDPALQLAIVYTLSLAATLVIQRTWFRRFV